MEVGALTVDLAAALTVDQVAGLYLTLDDNGADNRMGIEFTLGF